MKWSCNRYDAEAAVDKSTTATVDDNSDCVYSTD